MVFLKAKTLKFQGMSMRTSLQHCCSSLDLPTKPHWNANWNLFPTGHVNHDTNFHCFAYHSRYTIDYFGTKSIIAGTVCSVTHLFIFRLGNLVETKYLREEAYRNGLMLFLYTFGQIAVFGVSYQLWLQNSPMEKMNAKMVGSNLFRQIYFF